MTLAALITGNSSGIGLGLTEVLLDRGAQVYGVSRRGCPVAHASLHDVHGDLGQLDDIGTALSGLLDGVVELELVVLNAGILGDLKRMRDTTVEELEAIQRINVWSNKVILDWFIERGMPVTQIVMISSGAAVNGNLGWGGYALSKASLNMLAQLYAHELPATHVTALAPGLVDTAMQDYLCGEVDSADFPSVQKLKDARGTAAMPAPRDAAVQIIDLLPRLRGEVDSGQFVDVRQF